MTAITDTLPKPTKVSPRDKAAATDSAARAIIDAEVAKREKKTERLRQLRLEQEAAAPAPEPKKVKAKAAAKPRAKAAAK